MYDRDYGKIKPNYDKNGDIRGHYIERGESDPISITQPSNLNVSKPNSMERKKPEPTVLELLMSGKLNDVLKVIDEDEDIADVPTKFYNEMTNKIMDIDDFIKGHKHIFYCEAIIFPNGNISYAVPSHIDRMLQILGLSIMDARDVIPDTELPINWLMEKTGVIPVWYNGVRVPKEVTEAQAKSIIKLVANDIIQLNLMTDLCVTDEEMREDTIRLVNAINNIKEI